MKKRSNSPVKNSFYFDDCPICRDMKKAEEEGTPLSLEELQSSFQKANKLSPWKDIEKFDSPRRSRSAVS